MQSLFVPEDLSKVQAFLPAGLRAYGGISLQTTAPDYARFMLQMMQVGQGNTFQLAASFLDEMLKPHMRVGNRRDLSWGLGWGLQHEEGLEDSFWHWGARRSLTRNFALGYRTRQTGLVVFTTTPGTR
jgi:CubicO group peptidase (beta-lactamase class C family)